MQKQFRKLRFSYICREVSFVSVHVQRHMTASQLPHYMPQITQSSMRLRMTFFSSLALKAWPSPKKPKRFHLASKRNICYERYTKSAWFTVFCGLHCSKPSIVSHSVLQRHYLWPKPILILGINQQNDSHLSRPYFQSSPPSSSVRPGSYLQIWIHHRCKGAWKWRSNESKGCNAAMITAWRDIDTNHKRRADLQTKLNGKPVIREAKRAIHYQAAWKWTV